MEGGAEVGTPRVQALGSIEGDEGHCALSFDEDGGLVKHAATCP